MGKAVIDGLMRHPWQNLRNDGEHGCRVRVRLRPNRVEHSDTLTRNPQSNRPDQPFEILSSRITHRLHIVLS